MKKKVFYTLLCVLYFGSLQLNAQWLVGGNNLAANGSIGSNTNFPVIFESFNAERGRLTGAVLWGFGTAAPNSRVHIASVAGQNPLRVDVNGITQFLVHSGGGVSVGTTSTPPNFGLVVGGSIGIGTSAPENKLHVFRGSAGIVTGNVNAPLIVENSTNCYINLLSPNANETGILFGNPANSINGAITYNNLNNLTFKTLNSTTRMTLTAAGFLGMGTTAPVSDLHIVHANGFIAHGVTITDNFAANLQWNIYSATTAELWLSFNGIKRGTFNGMSGAYTAISDRKFKKDINGMESVLERVLQLKPSLYRFNNQPTADTRKFIGMIAQDVLALFPEAVYQHKGTNDGTDDFLTLDYSTFGVIAVKAIQEQQQKITSLEDRVAKLEAAINKLADNNQLPGNNISRGASLQQNQPNPFNQATIIRYAIPQAAKAQINIIDAGGVIVKTMNAPESGQVTINAFGLKAGTYIYRLVVDGKMASSKKMVVLK